MIDKKTLPLIVLLVIVIVFYFQIMEFLGIYSAPERTESDKPQPIAVDSGKQEIAEREALDSMAEHVREAICSGMTSFNFLLRIAIFT